MIVDSHQHYWNMDTPWFDWPTEDLTRIYRNFSPTDLAPLLSEQCVSGTVLVQAAPDLRETAYLLEIAALTPSVKGVVGWVDFNDPAASVSQLAAFGSNPRFCGIRPMLQAIADEDWILDHSFDPIFRYLQDAGLTFDALIQPRHLETISVLAERYPGLRIVIDHAAKPEIHRRNLGVWTDGISQLRILNNVYCKCSGLLTEALPDDNADQLRPVVNHLFDVFGTDRVMWGSDWPVINLVSDYGNWLEMSFEIVGDLSPAEKEAFFWRNADFFYSLNLKENESVRSIKA